jgi:hypothetical protein
MEPLEPFESESETESEPQRWRRSQPNPGALVAGALFIGLGVLFLVDAVGNVDLDVQWVWPILLIGLGVAGLVRARPRREIR